MQSCPPSISKEVLICAGGACLSSEAGKVLDRLRQELQSHGLADRVKVTPTGCIGTCDLGPVVVIQPEGTFYQQVKAEDVPRIIEEHLIQGQWVEDLLYRDPETQQILPTYRDLPFLNRQERIVLRNCGFIDPERLEEYLAHDGYQALRKAVTMMSPEQVIAEVKASGLRGRGGAGFPTGLKWELTRKAILEREMAGNGEGRLQAEEDLTSSTLPRSPGFVVCNGDEGDPGAFMDRSILEGDPHSVIEGMAIAGYAIGARQGYVYVRAEYPLAIERLTIALQQAREHGFLGENLFGTSFSFDIEIRIGAGAFVCGEETALLASIEGRRGMPRPRPPFPAQKGLWGRPTLINNVETLANINPILLRGGAWFASFGTEKSKGTKVFALAGDIANTGLVEVPLGISLRDIVYQIGGGIRDGKDFKAAQIGGPSGGCIPNRYLDVPIDYESLTELGAIMGSGGLIVVDTDTCMVSLAAFFLDFLVDESCGKCIPCRVGTKKMRDLLRQIIAGEGREGDIEKLLDLAQTIKKTSLCGLGQTAPNAVLSTIRHFRAEYEAHIYEKGCPALACRDLIAYWIDPEVCVGCGLCRRNCPVAGIIGERKEVHTIDQKVCTRCGTCWEVCPPKVRAVKKVTGRERAELLSAVQVDSREPLLEGGSSR